MLPHHGLAERLRAPSFHTLAVALVFVGLLGLLALPGVAAQGKDPGDVFTEIEGIQDAAAIPRTSQRYPNLDATLRDLVEDLEAGEASARGAAGTAPVHDETSVAVTIYAMRENVSDIRSFLASNGADPRNVGEDYIEAYVPVTLLGRVSEQPGVIRVRTFIPPKPLRASMQASTPVPTPPVPTPAPCQADLGSLPRLVPTPETCTGSWSSTSPSSTRGGRGFAHYYGFTLSQHSAVAIDLTSADADAYLYLLAGGQTGTVVVRNNRNPSFTTTNARIRTNLRSGSYTVEATTNARGETGSFMLTVGASPLDVCETSLGTLSAGSPVPPSSGTWIDTCDSANLPGHSARYYNFTLRQTAAVTMDLTSPDTDTYLYLLAGDWTGARITANNNSTSSTTNSRIRTRLTPGNYTVEATTFRSGVTGSFTLAMAVESAPSLTETHGVPAWRAVGFTGQGVKVGIIDAGFDGFGELMGTELPSTVHHRCYTRIGNFTQDLQDCEVDSQHGTAVAEAVFDIAPGAELYIANPESRGDVKDTAEWMISQGVTVVNYSIAWLWDGPGDGTSPFSDSPLRTVDAAVAGDILWVSAAGNAATETWFSRRYADADNNGFIDFGRTADGRLDNHNPVGLTRGRRFVAQLRWDDRWDGARRDLDLFLYHDSDGDGVIEVDEIVADSDDKQRGRVGHVPFEAFGYTPPQSGVYYLYVVHDRGDAPSWIQLQSFTGVRFMWYFTGYGSISNPAESANPGHLTVGAAPWANNRAIEPFSSRGPTPADGRIKPDLVGTDGGDSVAYRAYGRPRFYGTSQATPHVAGLAALVRQRFPTFTPAEVAQYLKDHAQQRQAPSPDDRDPNNIWGHGFAQLPTVLSTPDMPIIVTVTPDDQALTITWEAPTYTGSTAITAYDVRYRETGATDWQPVVDNAWMSGALEYTITGLTGNTEYAVQVRAVNAAGDGVWSRITTHSTLTATATTADPLTAMTTAPVLMSTTTATTVTTLEFRPGDELTFTPTTATEAGLTIKQTAATELEIRTTAMTTVATTDPATTLEFEPSSPLTFTLPPGRNEATLTFSMTTTTVLTLTLKRPPPPPRPPPPSGSSGSSGSSGGGSTSTPSTLAPAPAPPSQPLFSASTGAATVTEREDAPGQSSLVFQRNDRPAASFSVQIGWISRDGTNVIAIGFVRDADLGQTYAIVRRESDGRIVRLWVAPDSPLVYAVPWAEVNSRYTVPLAVLAAVPLDDQYPQPNQLVRRFDGGDGRIVAYDAGLGQWRHVPDLATFQALNFYWCDVTAADGAFFARITLGPPYSTSSTPARSDYPNCRT